METPGLFWGIVIKPEKRYETEVEEDFRVTKACVDVSTLEKGKVASVVLEKGGEEFILCNLNGPSNYDSTIDLSFAEGERICFRTEGGATVHLTGHLVPDDTPDADDSMMLGDSMFETSDGEEEEEAEDEEDSDDEEEEVPKLVEAAANGKRKLENGDSPKQSAKKAKKAEVKQAEAMKKILSKDKKKADEEEDSDDDDMEANMKNLEEEEESEDGEEESGEEEEEEEAPTPKKKKEETPKKDKKNKKQENGAAATNGQTPGKKEKKPQQEAAPLTPKSEGKPAAEAAETPKSKKKDKKKNKDKENKEGAPATPAAAAGDKPASSPTKTPKPQKKTLKGGIVAEDLRVGNGPEAKSGKHVGMYYKGTLTKSGKQFDACLQGKPFKFKLGKGEVIKGWDIGVEGMKVGGKRKLTIPAQMGYGAQGAMPDIPPNASLTFEVECKMVN